MLLKETCGIKRKNAVLIFSIIIVFLCQVHFVVKSQFFTIRDYITMKLFNQCFTKKFFALTNNLV